MPRVGCSHDLAVMLADGGTRLRHLDVLRGQPGLFGTVASVPTATRTLAALADDGRDHATVAALDAGPGAGPPHGPGSSGAVPAPVAAAAAGEDAGRCVSIWTPRW
jgi:hypothetical protein